MRQIKIPLFNAAKTSFWCVDGTTLTLVTDDAIPIGRVRENMRNDLAASSRNARTLPCVHFTESFLGIVGTYIHGRGWKLHKPKGSPGDLWKAAEHASVVDWTEFSDSEDAL